MAEPSKNVPSTQYTRAGTWDKMDTNTRDLINELTVELERCEGTITHLFTTLDRLGLADEAVIGVVHARQAAILELVRKVRGDSVRPGILGRR